MTINAMILQGWEALSVIIPENKPNYALKSIKTLRVAPGLDAKLCCSKHKDRQDKPPCSSYPVQLHKGAWV
jgi:hypothetical protein